MVVKKTKERLNQLASDVRRSQNEAASAIKEMLGLLIEEAKDSLVASQEGAETARLQGEAQALTRLHKLLTTEPVSINKGDKA